MGKELLNARLAWKSLEDGETAGLSSEDLRMIKRLEKPVGKVDVVLDTDTYNESDDQYALSYIIRSEEKLTLKAIYAAPFFNLRSSGPEDGMEKSYEEILKVLTLIKREDLKEQVYRGSRSYLRSETEPVISDAALDLARRAMDYTEEHPLYVIAIGAITNVASALLLSPEIKDRIVIVWLGGHAVHWPHTKEFNMWQDVAAARIVFGCGVPLVQLPCQGVVSEFAASKPELEYYLSGKNQLCDYLKEITIRDGLESGGTAWAKVIWDVTAPAWLLDGMFETDCFMRSPIPEYDGHYSFDEKRHLMKYVYWINRCDLFADLFEKLQKQEVDSE